MRVPRLGSGPGRIRALWRALLFLVATTALLFVLGDLASILVPRTRGAIRELAASSVIVAATLIASYAMMRWVEKRPRPLASLGLPLGRETHTDLLRGAAIGGGLITLLVAVQLAFGWLRPTPESGTVVGWFEHVGGLALLLALAAAAEELLFRGYAFQVLVQGFGVKLAVVLGAVLFASLHADNPEVGYIALLNIALAGILLAGAYLRTRSLWVAIGLHWGWNWLMAAVFDLPVSGLVFDAPGYDLRELGPDVITGGAFGPEGGLLTTLLLVPAIVWVFRTPGLQAAPRMAELAPLVDETRAA